MMLSAHFSIEELIDSQVGRHAGVDNTPPPDVVANLAILAEGLERVRLALRSLPVHVSSGYRSPRLNQLVGGSPNSAHMRGLAADIICPQFGTPLEVCRAIAAAHLDFDQVIHEFGGWCHVGFVPAGETPRRELLTIATAATGYELGLRTV